MVQALHCDAHVFAVLHQMNFYHSIQINSVRSMVMLSYVDAKSSALLRRSWLMDA